VTTLGSMKLPELMITAVTANPDPFLILDAAGDILFTNPAANALLGAGDTELVGVSFVRTLNRGSHLKAAVMLRDALEGKSGIYELSLQSLNAAKRTSAVQSADPVTAVTTVTTVSFRTVPILSEQPTILLFGHLLSQIFKTTEQLITDNERLHVLFSISELTRTLSLTELLQQTLFTALRQLDLLGGAIYLVNVQSQRNQRDIGLDGARLAAYEGLSPEFAARLAQVISPFSADELAQGEVLIRTGTLDDLGMTDASLVSWRGPLLTVAIIPLNSENRLIGWFYLVTDRYRAFQNEELGTLSTMGNLLGPAVENARLNEALLQTTGQLNAVLNNIDSGILLIDTSGIVRYANHRLGSLFNVDDVHVLMWLERAREDVPLNEHIAPLTLTDSPFEGDLFQTVHEPHRILQHSRRSIHNTAGEPIGVIETFVDVTQIHRSNQLKDDFVAAAAHDLKTPMTAIKGYSQLATRMAKRNGDQKLLEQLEMIAARSSELTYLIDSILDVSRIQGGRLRLEHDTFELGTLVDRVARYFNYDLQRKGRVLNTVLTGEPIPVTWDAARIERVIVNLVDNAIKYSPNGEPVALEVHPIRDDNQNSVQITITDHGIGIPPEERTRVFDKFYRTQQATDAGFKGTGLGLFICQYIVEAHGGEIHIEAAKHGGQGTAVVFTMPAEIATNSPK
jgi:two-component system, OmpR family, phosphate regulon sensor histidine kinase PhoR